MTIDFQIILITLLTTLYFILPAYFANGGALVFGGGTPIDFGKSDSNGVRWVGDGVTWRGMIVGTIIGMITGAVQGYIAPMILPYIGSSLAPVVTSVSNGLLIGFLLGFGALLAPILDQLDFIIVALILVSPVISLNWIFIVLALLLTLFIHLITNTCAYLLGLKDVWY